MECQASASGRGRSGRQWTDPGPYRLRGEKLAGFSKPLAANEAARLAATGAALFVDLRSRKDFALGRAPGSAHMPLEEFRDRLDELARDRSIVLVSKAGFEGHIALRQLLQAGFEEVSYVSGGWTILALEKGSRAEAEA